jgi:transcription elongation factor GreA
MTTFYLTKARLEELERELKDLKTRKRLEVSERLKRAKEFGDLSENSEYSEAKEEQSQVESRIFELEEIIKNASIIKKNSDKSEIVIGSTVLTVKGGKEFKYQIVGSNEAMPEEGRISNESPLGRAFLGKKVGDMAEVLAPSGKISYKIVGIE